MTLLPLQNIVAYDCIKPWSILAITFTNKAAGELKERLAGMLGEAGQRHYSGDFPLRMRKGYSGVNVTSLDFQAVSPFMILTILKGL